jgi:hypothetical protein
MQKSEVNMKDLPECYGAQTKETPCADCWAKKWCDEAGDPPLLRSRGDFSRDASPTMIERFATHPELDVNRSLSKLLTEFFHEVEQPQAEALWDFLSAMSALSKEHPETYNVVRLRILNPSHSYAKLGGMCDLSKVMVLKHLNKAVELINSLKATMPANKFDCHAEKILYVRCEGNMICVRRTDTGEVVLQAPHTLENGHGVEAMVRALGASAMLLWRNWTDVLDSKLT